MPFDANDPADPRSDSALLAAYGRGEQAAAAVLTARLAPRAYRLAARYLGDVAEAEDVAQEAMLRLWRAAPGWQADGPAQPATWLYRVVMNLCTDKRRRARPIAPLEAVPEPADPAPAAEARLHQQARAEALEAALATLPPRQRQAVILRHLEGLSNPEIAAAMEIGIEAVESLTARGKRALAAQLRPQQEALGHDTR